MMFLDSYSPVLVPKIIEKSPINHEKMLCLIGSL